MKKLLAILVVFVLLLCSSCGGNSENTTKTNQTTKTSQINKQVNASNGNTETTESETNSDEVINITEDLYVTLVNEIYNNMKSYVGNTIEIEGCFASEQYNGKTYNYVYRTGPGCCGSDGSMCGFEFTWDGDMPSNNDWIKVVGELTYYEEDDQTYLSIEAKTVDTLTERGNATVSQ